MDSSLCTFYSSLCTCSPSTALACVDLQVPPTHHDVVSMCVAAHWLCQQAELLDAFCSCWRTGHEEMILSCQRARVI